MAAVPDSGGTRLAVTGDLDLATADGFAAEVRRLAVNGGSLLLDLSCVQFMDSRGLEALVSTVGEARQHDCQIRLGPQLAVQVRRVLELTGAHRFLCLP